MGLNRLRWMLLRGSSLAGAKLVKAYLHERQIHVSFKITRRCDWGRLGGGRTQEPYLTFRDGWRYQEAIDAIRAERGWHELPV